MIKHFLITGDIKKVETVIKFNTYIQNKIWS